MATIKSCLECNAQIPDDAPKGLCSACLIRLAAPQYFPGSTLPHNAGSDPAVIPYDNDYQLLEIIGSGGMGIVWKAHQLSLNRFVALKKIGAGKLASDKQIERFKTEAAAAAKLEHPHIVPIYHTGNDEGEYYYSMKLINGRDLAHALKGTSMEPLRAAAIFAKVARAVHYAHQRRVVHRDLKPRNILLDGDDNPYVADFGLARSLDSDGLSTASQALIGTLAYMAPEQADNKDGQVTTAFDVYSLGAIFFELLNGTAPFTAPNEVALLKQVLEQEPKRTSAKVPIELETIYSKCLEKDPGHRYASAAALADDVERWLRNEPILARPSSQWQKMCKWAKRKPAIAVLGAALICAIAVGLAGTVWKGHVAKKNLVLAKDSEADARATLQFLEEKVLAAARPQGWNRGLGRNVTLRQAIDSAEPSIASIFTNRPLAEASIRHILGMTYGYLGSYTNAVRQHRLALELRKQHLGLRNPETLAAMHDLAKSCGDAGLWKEALALSKEVWEGDKATVGPNHTNTIQALNTLAAGYRRIGQPKKALELFIEDFDRARTNLGSNHPLTLTAMKNLAVSYQDDGQWREALALHEKAVKLTEDKFGPEHPDTLSAKHNLADSLSKADRLADAVAVLTNVVELRKTKLGPDHPDTLRSMNSLSAFYRDQGDFTNSVLLNEQILQVSVTNLGPNHPETLWCRHALAISYRDIGRWREALALKEETLKIAQTNLPAEHPDILIYMHTLANSYGDADEWDKARVLHEETLRLKTKKWGRENPDTLSTMHNLAEDYHALHRFDEAIALHKETLELRIEHLKPNHPDTLRSMQSLADTYRDAGRTNDAANLQQEILRLKKG